MARIEQMGFGWDLVSSIAGLSKRQLSYWDKTGFFRPEYRDDSTRLYSFRDLVGLRTIAKLREQVSLQELRKIKPWLQEVAQRPWSSLRLYLWNRTIYFRDPKSEAILSTKPQGQIACIELQPIASEVHEIVNARRQRSHDDIGKVVKKRMVAKNQPVLAGTRIPAQAIWNFHEAGYSEARILEEYPSLSPEDVRAAIEYVEHQKAS